MNSEANSIANSDFYKGCRDVGVGLNVLIKFWFWIVEKSPFYKIETSVSWEKENFDLRAKFIWREITVNFISTIGYLPSNPNARKIYYNQ